MGMASDGEELDTFRAKLVMISRVAEIRPPIDGVTPAIDDAQLLEAETTKAKRWGFAGKLCIHPKQVSTINDCFASSEAEIAWAKKVLDAFERANGAAVAVDGKMVDRPVIIRAQGILDASRGV
jgi:citrate lyase subunit beta/citryl-CoA lyase